MASVADVKITITAQDGSQQAFNAVAANSRNAAGGIDDFERSTKKANSTALEFVKGLALWEAVKTAAGWLKDLAGGFLESGNATEQYQARLETLLGSQKEGSRLFKEMADYAARVPFEFNNVMASATQLAGVMKGGVNEIKAWMPMIGDLAAASGLSIEETTGQVIRMYSAGAGAADLFRERGILAMMGFQAGATYSAEETRKKMMDEWTKADSQFKGATDKLAGTWEGAMSMMKDKWFQFKDAVMKAGVMDWLKASLGLLQNEMDAAFDNGNAQKWAQTVATYVISALEMIAKGAAYVADAFRGWNMLWDVLKIAFASVSEFILAGVGKIGSGIKNTMEATNIGGIFDGAIAKLGTFEEKIAGLRTEMLGMKADAQLDLGEIAGGESAVKKVETFFGKVHAKMDELKKKAQETAAETGRIASPAIDPAPAIAALKAIGIEAGGMKKAIADAGSQASEQMAQSFIEDFGNVKHYLPDAIQQSVTASAKPIGELKQEAADIAVKMKDIKLGDMNSAAAIKELGDLRDRADEIKKQLAIIAEPRLKMEALNSDLTKINSAIDETAKLIETPKAVNIDGSKVKAEAILIRQSIDAAIPDQMIKYVTIQYQTKASPVMPFTEGMTHIKEMMNSLPTGGDYTVKFGNLASEWTQAASRYDKLEYNPTQGWANLSYGALKQRDEAERESNKLYGEMLAIWKASQKAGTGGGTVNYSPTINVQAGVGKDGKSLAKEIDTQMADDMRSGRSATLVEIKRQIGTK